MIIVWKRWGILMPILCILGAVLTDYLFHPVGRMQSAYFFVPAALVSLTGLLLDRIKQANEFYFVSMKYWGLIVAVFGFVILFCG
jgi:hypothetical protein